MMERNAAMMHSSVAAVHADAASVAGADGDDRPKRKYSKTGCKECKRRKMKCDEGKPVCWHCRRLNKECVYEPVRYKRPRKPQGSQVVVAEVPRQAGRSPAAPLRSQYNSPLALPNILNHMDNVGGQFGVPVRPYLNYQVDAAAKVESPVSLGGSVGGGSSQSESSALPLDSLVSIPQYFHDELFVSNANVMAQNLNDMLTQRLEEAADVDADAKQAPIPISGTANLSAYNLSVLDQLNTRHEARHQARHEAPRVPHLISYNMRELHAMPQVPLYAFNLGEPHQRYLELFYKDFARIIVPFQVSEAENPVRDILLTLATKNAFLMSAILACGARSAIKMDPRAAEFEQAYFAYLSSCLAALSKILNSPKKKLLENVEPLLLTILLLTSDNASSKNQAWRAHLRGAKDLLLMYAQAKRDAASHVTSLVFTICVNWYIAFEVLAGAGGAPLGGTFDTEEEMDLLMRFDADEIRHMRAARLVLADDYNIFSGYTISMTELYRDLIKLFNRDRRRDRHGAQVQQAPGPHGAPPPAPPPPASSAYQAAKLLGDLERESRFCVVDASGLVPRTHYMHPDAGAGAAPPAGTAAPLPPSAIGSVVTPQGDLKVFCWYDICQQLCVKSAMLAIFRKCFRLPKESAYVQEMVRDILGMFHFLDSPDSPKVYHLMMVQQPMWEAGSCCIRAQDQAKVEKFFNLLREVHVGSAEYVLKRLRRRWARGAGAGGAVQADTGARGGSGTGSGPGSALATGPQQHANSDDDDDDDDDDIDLVTY